jgi:Leucine-rich repeat (LRR) protein
MKATKKDQLINKAKLDLQVFIDYLKAHNLSDTDIQDRLGELEVYYNQTTNQAVIIRADHRLFELDLSQLNLTGELPLPKQLLISKLNCYKNQLEALPELPASLTTLFCNNNQLQTLPELPANLTWLDCSNNQLQTLPKLPASLTELYCYKNQLQTLPELPDRLKWLWCDKNQLQTLPKLPDSLTNLYCSNNRLRILPELPANLAELWCFDNPLTKATKQAIEARGFYDI